MSKIERNILSRRKWKNRELTNCARKEVWLGVSSIERKLLSKTYSAAYKNWERERERARVKSIILTQGDCMHFGNIFLVEHLVLHCTPLETYSSALAEKTLLHKVDTKENSNWPNWNYRRKKIHKEKNGKYKIILKNICKLGKQDQNITDFFRESKKNTDSKRKRMWKRERAVQRGESRA